jgi:hypothetical protein
MLDRRLKVLIRQFSYESAMVEKDLLSHGGEPPSIL